MLESASSRKRVIRTNEGGLLALAVGSFVLLVIGSYVYV